MAEAQSIFIPKISPGDLASLDYWTPNDAIFPERGTGVTASTERTQSVGNRPVLLFPAPSDEGDTAAVLFDGSMGEDYGGGIITFDIYWFPETGAAGDVCLTLLLVRENPGILFDPLVPTVPFKSVVVAAPGTSLEIQKATIFFSNAEADGVQPGDPFLLFFGRDVSDNDTYPDDVGFFRLNMKALP